MIELIVATGVIGLALFVGMPRIDILTARIRLDSAANEVAAILRNAHQQAALRGHNAGLKFYPSVRGETTYGLYLDGDFDGVRTVDIESGVDRELVHRRPVQHLGKDIRFGIPLDANGKPPRAPNSRRRITRPEDPIRFNRSDIASFGRSGGATPGTVYLTDGYHAIAVRVLNRTGKIQVLRYNHPTETWR